MKTIICISFFYFFVVPNNSGANTATFPQQQSPLSPLNQLSPFSPLNSQSKNNKSTERDKKPVLDSIPKKEAKKAIMFAIAGSLLMIIVFVTSVNTFNKSM